MAHFAPKCHALLCHPLPMANLSTRSIGWLPALVFAALSLAGCAWRGKAETAESPTTTLFKSELRLPGSPRERVGVDARSREIEKNLGF